MRNVGQSGATRGQAPAVTTDLSCVIPAFENLDLLARCVTSAVVQQEAVFEVVVSDDSRSSRVRDFVAVLTKTYPMLRYVEGPRSGNPVENWNHGLRQACAEVCILAHHDEFFVDPRFFRRAIDALARPGVAAVVGQTVVIGVNRASNFARVSVAARRLGRPAWMLPAFNWIGPTACFAFRRGPCFDPSLINMVDVEFYRRVLRSGRLEMLSGVCVGSLGHHGAQISAGLDKVSVDRQELRAMAAQLDPMIGRLEHAAHQAWQTIRPRRA